MRAPCRCVASDASPLAGEHYRLRYLAPVLLPGVAWAGALPRCRRWERGWCSPYSPYTTANTDFSCVRVQGKVDNKAVFGGKWAVAGWTVVVTQDMGKEDCSFRVFLNMLLSCSETCCCVCLQVHAAYARHCSGFFWVSSCKRDVRNTTCSPKISSGTDFLCFLYRNGSVWTSVAGCWPVLFSCVLVWCTEITLISSFLSWIIF